MRRGGPGRPFPPGVSGNPKGKPKGTRDGPKVRLLLAEMITREDPALRATLARCLRHRDYAIRIVSLSAMTPPTMSGSASGAHDPEHGRA
jgi:hypothetical protein